MDGLAAYEAEHGPLPGIEFEAARRTLVRQMVSSLRRIEYVRGFRNRPVMSPDRIDPRSSLFDPLRGAFYLERKGLRDEAVWLAFVGTHFGKHAVDAWKLASNVMGSFGTGPVWTAQAYGNHPADFEAMLELHQAELRSPEISGRFSNHRQYQSKATDLIAKVFASFHAWQFEEGGIDARIRAVHDKVGQEPTAVFRALYKSMNPVYGFGRLGKFDFLTMIGKLDLAPIDADSVHFSGATGPLAGGRLLVTGDPKAKATAKAVEAKVDMLDAYLGVGKQVLEDSLCNWQKSPTEYEYFRG
jgi:hypothetical protein